MDRRDALKSLSLSLGYAVAPATLAGLAASCRAEPATAWEPLFLSPDQARIVEELGETFLPQTRTPGAKAVRAHVFVDRFLARVANSADQETFNRGLTLWLEAFEQQIGKSFDKATPEDYRAGLAAYFELTDARQEEIKTLLDGAVPASTEDAATYHIYDFLFVLKRLIMLGFYASEEIGEQVLSYLPVPGRYEACIPADRVGNAWSL